jgi:hypothetical protein
METKKNYKKKTNHWFAYGRKTIKLTVYFLIKTQTVTLNFKSDNRKTNRNPQQKKKPLQFLKRKNPNPKPFKKKKKKPDTF